MEEKEQESDSDRLRWAVDYAVPSLNADQRADLNAVAGCLLAGVSSKILEAPVVNQGTSGSSESK